MTAAMQTEPVSTGWPAAAAATAIAAWEALRWQNGNGEVVNGLLVGPLMLDKVLAGTDKHRTEWFAQLMGYTP